MLQDYIKGFHHVTSGVGGAQEDINFFTSIIGQRMVKQTVLFDGELPIYHLYYANRDAEIGTVMTTFPYKQQGIYGRKGSGQVKITSYSVPESSLSFWQNHFHTNGVTCGPIEERFGQKRIHLSHPSGLEFELVADDSDPRAGYVSDVISEAEAVKGIHSVTMSVREVGEQSRFLEDVMGYQQTGREGNYYRFELNEGGAGKTIFLLHEPDVPQGSWILGCGTVHHVAFAVDTDEELKKVKAIVEGIGYTDISEIKDRNYFHSIYVRSPGGILCEFASCDIGFMIDETKEELGTKMLLPPWKESDREEIVSQLEPIVNPQAKVTM